MQLLVLAFDAVFSSETTEAHLCSLAAEITDRAGSCEPSRSWLEQGARLVAEARGTLGDLQARALALPELAVLRKDHARAMQGAVVDALEALSACIATTAGPRSPVIEALFMGAKLPLLRKAKHDVFVEALRAFEHRLGSSYPQRMLAGEDYAPVLPAVETVRSRIREWRLVFATEVPDETAAQATRHELEGAMARLSIPLQQARLLAEAALVPYPDLLDTWRAAQKKRRKLAREDSGAELGAEQLELPESDAHMTDAPAAEASAALS